MGTSDDQNENPNQPRPHDDVQAQDSQPTAGDKAGDGGGRVLSASASASASASEPELGPGPEHPGLARILELYESRLEAGPISAEERAAFLAEHGALGPQLEEALAGLEFIHGARKAGGGAVAPVQLGDFRIVREIGRGGMGVVYEAEQISLKRRVALKVLQSGRLTDEMAMRRFQREAETVGRLHHTNIVPIFAIGAEGGVRYYAMQFIEGRDLAALALEARRKGGRIYDAREVAQWALQAAEALAHAHKRGVIHRDIKPSNLILDPEGRIWLTDFGLARRMDDVSLSLTGALLGTPRYMSPEQASSALRPVDHRTDIYSLGATLYELCTRHPIFEAAHAHEVLARILHEEPKAPRQLAPDLPRDFETIVLKCLAKEPEGRYADAGALADDLRAFLEGRALRARRPRVTERVVRWARQNRRVVAAATASVAVSLLAVAAVYYGMERARRAKIGRVVLHAGNGQGLLAEVLDEQGAAVTSLIPVPTESPLELDAGAYRLRVGAPGMPSRTWDMDVVAGEWTQPVVQMPSPWLWPPIQNPADEYQTVEFVNRGGGRTNDLLVCIEPRANGAEGGVRPRRLRLLSGVTGQAVWPQDLVFDETSLPATTTSSSSSSKGGSSSGSGNGAGGDYQGLEAWRRVTGWAGVTSSFQNTGIGERVNDLDGDGVGDLVLLSRSSPSLLAVSGATGKVLWWHRDEVSSSSSSSSRGTVVGMPAMADVDGDGVPDVIALFHSDGERVVSGDGAENGRIDRAPSWIAAVGGRTGALLWERPLQETPWRGCTSNSMEAEKHHGSCRVMAGTVGGRAVVAAVIGADLFGWEQKTGVEAWPTIHLGRQPLGEPRMVDLGAANGTGVLTVQPTSQELSLVEVSMTQLPGGRELWTRSVYVDLDSPRAGTRAGAPPLYLEEDLDGDGRAEIVIAPVHVAYGQDSWAGIEVFNAVDGKKRWQTKLWTVTNGRYVERYATRMVIGPDLNKDGVRDVFTAWPAQDAETREQGVMVAALSGKDGTVLWRRHQPGVDRVGAMAWWKAGADGWPQLLLSTQRIRGGRPMTLILAGGAGHCEDLILDVTETRVADLDGDGMLDLFHPLISSAGARWAAVRGEPAGTWRRFGEWQAGPDVDHDGWSDLVGIESGVLKARSGRNGGVMWAAKADFCSPAVIAVPRKDGRATGVSDGAPFVVAAVNVPQGAAGMQSAGPWRTLAAFGSADGRLLWTASKLNLGVGTSSGTMMGWAYEYPHLAFKDLDGDRFPEVLATFPDGDGDLATKLAVVAGRTGELLWTMPVVPGCMAVDPRPAGAPFGDFNRDGVLDVALILGPGANKSEPGCRLQVCDGRTGKGLWGTTLSLGDEPRNLCWPEAALGDLDGDGVPEVGVVRHADFDSTHGAYVCELIVLDGVTGQVRWKWSWKTGFPELWPPIFLRGVEPGSGRVALAVNELGPMSMVVLDSAGKERVRRPARPVGNSLRPGSMVWRSVDLDGNGTSELLYMDGHELCAAGGAELGVLWRHRIPSPAESVRVFDVEMGTQPGMSVTRGLILWAGHELECLEGGSGKVLWLGRTKEEAVWGSSRSPGVQLLGRGIVGAGAGMGMGIGSGLPRFQELNGAMSGAATELEEFRLVPANGR